MRTVYPVTLDSRSHRVGRGSPGAHAVANLLDHLVAREVERKALGAEVLHLYREINLIYSFSEKLAAMLDLERVARLTLQEARHLIVATDGVVMLLDEGSGALAPLAAFGDALSKIETFRRGEGIIGAIAASGIAEVDRRRGHRPAAPDGRHRAAFADLRAAEGRRARHRR